MNTGIKYPAIRSTLINSFHNRSNFSFPFFVLCFSLSFSLYAGNFRLDTLCAYGSFFANDSLENFPVVLNDIDQYHEFVHDIHYTDVHTELEGYQYKYEYLNRDCCTGLDTSVFDNRKVFGFRSSRVCHIESVVLADDEIVVNYIREEKRLMLQHFWIAPDGTFLPAMGVTVFSVSSDSVSLKDKNISFSQVPVSNDLLYDTLGAYGFLLFGEPFVICSVFSKVGDFEDFFYSTFLTTEGKLIKKEVSEIPNSDEVQIFMFMGHGKQVTIDRIIETEHEVLVMYTEDGQFTDQFFSHVYYLIFTIPTTGKSIRCEKSVTQISRKPINHNWKGINTMPPNDNYILDLRGRMNRGKMIPPGIFLDRNENNSHRRRLVRIK